MDDLTPPLLTAIREIRAYLLAGRSIKESVNAYLCVHTDEFAARLHEFWTLKIQGQPVAAEFDSHRAEALWDLIERAYQGQPILEPLGLLEDDVEAAAMADLELHVAMLPFKALAPLLFLQFPAFALLLLGPLLRDLARYSMIFAVAAMGVALTSSAGAEAEALSSAAIRKISRAQKISELDQIQRAFDELRVMRMACDIQLKERSVPAACYQALELERKWGLNSPSLISQLRARIDRRCAEAAHKFEGTEASLPRSVSAVCRTRLAKAKELRDYQRFDWRGS